MSRNRKFHNSAAAYSVSFATVYRIDVFTWQIYFDILEQSNQYCRKKRHGIVYVLWLFMPSHVHFIFRSTATSCKLAVAGGHGPSTSNAHPFEIILDKSFLGTKADCVYKKLAKLNGNLFKTTIGKFIDDPKYNLTFKVGDCGSRTDDACTNANNINSTGNVVITIEDVNQSGLGIAALILHEGLHAEMHRYVSRFKAGVDPNNRARLFQLYAHYKGWAAKYQDPDYNWKQVAHHAYMVENYVKKIASAIRQLDDNKYPLSHYMAYGWDGLTSYGYTAKRLTEFENSKNQQLRKIADFNSSICK